MMEKHIGLAGFREYLPSYKGKWTPDTGPVVNGMGVAATGLGLKAAASIGDKGAHAELRKSVNSILGFCQLTKNVPRLNALTAIGSDLLASAVYLNSTRILAPNQKTSRALKQKLSVIKTFGTGEHVF